MKTTDLILSWNNINNRISIIKIISTHYFFLIKENQQFVYNFYSWKLIIKQQDIWVLINRRIIGLIPNWIISLNQEITKYRIGHPWKYRGIKFSIITLMKLIGLGFLLPYYGVVKGIYYFSKLPMPTKSLVYNFLLGELTWKKIFFLVSAGVSGVLLYNNFFCIVAQCSEEKFDIAKSQSNLGAASEKLMKSKYFWETMYREETYLEKIQERKLSTKEELIYIKGELLNAKKKLEKSNSFLDYTKGRLDFATYVLNYLKEKYDSQKAELIYLSDKLEDSYKEIDLKKAELANADEVIAKQKNLLRLKNKIISKQWETIKDLEKEVLKSKHM